MIKIMLARRIRRRDYQKLIGLLKDIRGRALHQPGYVTGETLVRGYDPVDVVTVGTWISEEHWKAWLCSEERIRLDGMTMPLLLKEPKLCIYQIPNGSEDEDEEEVAESVLMSIFNS